jgi:Domain of unknown function (DUF2760)
VPDTPDAPLPFPARLWFAFVCFFRVLLDGRFAGRVWQAREAEPALPPREAPAGTGRDSALAGPSAPPRLEAPAAEAHRGEPAHTAPPAVTPALQLLALLQREGRLVDFLEQDIASFSDAEIGAAARVVHEGCRKALRGHATLAPVRAEEEGARVTLQAGFNPAEVKLIGNVAGSAPYKGVLRHRGWRAGELSLPTPVAGHDATLIAPAEVEL